MNNITYSGILVQKEKVGFGIVAKATLLKLAIAVFPDKSLYFIASVPANSADDSITQNFMSDLADKLVQAARKRYHETTAERFVPEILAYIRSLPQHSRSLVYDTATASADDPTAAEVREALSSSLRHSDPFRASVDFETRTPFLIADQEIVNVMRHIIRDAEAGYDSEKWMCIAASEFEQKLQNSSQSFKSLIDNFRFQRSQRHAAMS